MGSDSNWARQMGSDPNWFARALRSEPVAIIAELKRRSPSKGVLNDAMPTADRVRAYEEGGAAALSILTEPEEFGGSIADVRTASCASVLPILKKDFHVEPVQVQEAMAVGSSALLLIARALGPIGLRRMLGAVRDVGIGALVEVRSEAELTWALDCEANVIGVNCRDLETLALDREVHERLLPLVPAGCIAVAESGVRTRQDVERLASLGADAVLVGSVLSLSIRASDAVAALTGVPRIGRAT